MPQGRNSNNENNMRLVEQQIGARYKMMVVSEEQYQKIKEAYEKKGIAAALQAKIESNKKLHQAWIAEKRNELNEELNRIDRTAKDETERLQQRKAAQANFAADKERYEKQFSQKQSALEANLTAQRKKDEAAIAKIAQQYAQKQYENASVYQRLEIKKQEELKAGARKKELQEQQGQNQIAIENITKRLEKLGEEGKSSQEAVALRAQLKSLTKEQAEVEQKIIDATLTENEAAAEKFEWTKKITDAQIKTLTSPGKFEGASKVLEDVESSIEDAKARLEQVNLEIAVNEELGVDKSIIDELKAESEKIKGFVKEAEQTASSLYKAASEDKYQKKHDESKKILEKTAARSTTDMAREIADDRKQQRLENEMQAAAEWQYFLSPEGIGDKVGEAVGSAVGKLGEVLNKFTQAIDNNIDSFYAYQASIDARLQGSDESYQKSLKNVRKNVGISGVFSQKEVVENIKKLVEAGIAYNLDLRAFLGSVSEDIAQTFDAFDSNLMRLIRLQQADTTAARLGMESALNSFLNRAFSDSSYLNDAFDDVSKSIIEANSQLTRDMSIEFEYMLQKWLGSLYSVGFSDSTITTIAQGMNYLGTGNVDALNSNDQLQNLMAMSAYNAGLSYADILTNGLDADTTNKLMKSMILYLKSIAENTDHNQVTKSAYSNVFDFNIADLTAVSSLDASTIDSIYASALSYNDAMSEVSYQLGQIYNRTHISQIFDQVVENATLQAATAIGDSGFLYATWQILNVIEGLTGGIAIPGISIMGNMVDLHQTVTGLAKAGIGGLTLLGSLLGSVISGGNPLGSTDVNSWGYDQFTSRGSPTKGISKGVVSGFSSSNSMDMVGSASSSDIKTTTLTDGTAEAEEDSKITNANVEDNADIYDKIYKSLSDESTSVLLESIKTSGLLSEVKEATQTSTGHLQSIESLLDRGRVFKTEMDGMSTLTSSMKTIEGLLSRDRVFYSAIIDNIPITLTSSKGHLLVDESSSVSSIVSANNAMSKVVDSVVSSRLDTSITDIWEIINPLVDAADGKTANMSTLLNSAKEVITTNVLQSILPDIVIPKDELSRLSGGSTFTKNDWEILYDLVANNSSLSYSSDETFADTMIVLNSQLEAVESILGSLSNYNQWNEMAEASKAHATAASVNVSFPDSMSVTVSDIVPGLRAYLEKIILENVAAAFSTGGADSASFNEQLKTILDDTLSVKITNDFFDEFVRKSAFSN